MSIVNTSQSNESELLDYGMFGTKDNAFQSTGFCKFLTKYRQKHPNTSFEDARKLAKRKYFRLNKASRKHFREMIVDQCELQDACGCQKCCPKKKPPPPKKKCPPKKQSCCCPCPPPCPPSCSELELPSFPFGAEKKKADDDCSDAIISSDEEDISDIISMEEDESEPMDVDPDEDECNNDALGESIDVSAQEENPLNPTKELRNSYETAAAGSPVDSQAHKDVLKVPKELRNSETNGMVKSKDHGKTEQELLQIIQVPIETNNTQPTTIQIENDKGVLNFFRKIISHETRVAVNSCLQSSEENGESPTSDKNSRRPENLDPVETKAPNEIQPQTKASKKIKQLVLTDLELQHNIDKATVTEIKESLGEDTYSDDLSNALGVLASIMKKKQDLQSRKSPNLEDLFELGSESFINPAPQIFGVQDNFNMLNHSIPQSRVLRIMPPSYDPMSRIPVSIIRRT